MHTKLQFRVLYRQFLFRLMDVELLSASARGDASTMFGQFASLLIFGSLLSAYVSMPIGGCGAGIWIGPQRCGAPNAS